MHNQSCIIYAPKKSITHQKLNGKRIEDAFRNVAIFLENCTNAAAGEPSSIQLVAYSPGDQREDSQLSNKYISEINALFGEGKKEPLAYSYPSGEPSKEFKITWVLEIKRFARALEYIIKGQPWPKHTFGPVELIIHYSFTLIDPDTRLPLSDQEVSYNGLLVWFSGIKTCCATLTFPFEHPTDQFFNYIDKIAPYMPFKFERKFLRIAKPNKAQTGYIYKKII